MSPQEKHLRSLQKEFAGEIGAFLAASQIPADSSLQFAPGQEEAESVFLITGASFTAFDKNKHGDDPNHAFYRFPSQTGGRYLMNNSAALLERLMDEGRRVLVHSGNPDLARALILNHPNGGRVRVVGGSLNEPAILPAIYRELESMAAGQPISSVSMTLYQSFAQGAGEPFKPLHREPVAEAERAAVNRLRFFYNMAAMGYDFLVNRNLEDLRIVSLSALAANRASYGLLADAADKFMNELVWRTYHLEANISTEKPVTIYQIKPGITTACDVYSREETVKTVCRESIADGFPLDDDLLEEKTALPSISARDVAWVAHKMLVTPFGDDPNDEMPESVRELLFGGFEPGELMKRFNEIIRRDGNTIAVDPDRILPEHMLTAATQYGALPSCLKKGEYRSISLCPPGQRF